MNPMWPRLFIVLIFIVLTFGCEKNHPPVISGITCTPDTRKAGTVFTLKVTASDEDGNTLYFLWKAEEGVFNPSANTREVTWESPITGGGKTIVLSVTVSDGESESSMDYPILLETPDLGSIDGYVKYTSFNIPIPDATVTFAGQTTTTRSDGYFILSNIPVSTYPITISKPDFSTFTSSIKLLPNATVRINPQLYTITYSTKLSGIVTDQDDIPLLDVNVLVLNPNGTYSDLLTTTDDKGYFRLWYIPFGQRKVLLWKEDTNDYYFTSITQEITFDQINMQLSFKLQKNSFAGTFVDPRDNHTYKYKKYKSGTWMTENLAYLPAVYPSTDGSSKEERYYVYGYQGTDTAAARSASNYVDYGVLYNGTAAQTACPPGWHMPSYYEWTSFIYSLDTDPIKQLKSTSGWTNHGNGNNASGFSVYPGGELSYDGEFVAMYDAAYFWTSSTVAYMKPGSMGFFYDSDYYSYISSAMKMGNSIRCKK